MSESKNHSKQFKKYLKGEMNPSQAHAFEREDLDDAFTQEAMEGFELNGIDHLQDLDALQKKVQKKKRGGFALVQFASAAILILVSGIFIYFYLGRVEQKQSLVLSEETTEQSQPVPVQPGNTLSKQDQVIDDEVVSDITFHLDQEQVGKEVTQNSKTIDEDNEPNEDDFSTAIASADVPANASQVPDEANIRSSFPPKISLKKAFLDSNLTAIAMEVPNTEDAFPIALDEEYTEEVVLPDVETSRPKTSGSATGYASRSRDAEVGALVTGKVTDISGESLPGVNVVIKGTTTGTQTDLDGNYRLPKSTGLVLIFSYVGFETTEIEVGQRSTVDVSLGGQMELQEVVVTALGSDQETTPSFTAASPSIGKKAFREYLDGNLKYPEQAFAKQIEGTVVLQLTVSPLGTIESINVKKSVDGGCDEEAIRLINDGPAWNPAEKGGRKIEDKVKVKVKFKIE